MIELHGDVVAPNFEESDDYRAGMAIAQNEDIKELLEKLSTNIERLANFSERQRASQAQTVITLGSDSGKAGAGTAAGATWQTTQAFRVEGIIITGGGGVGGDNIRLSIGSVTYNFFCGVGPYIPFPILIDRGIDINVKDLTNVAGVFTFLIFGYPA